MKFIPYPLYGNHFCAGYQNYLSNIVEGKIYTFNFRFFLFNIFWLAHHRMYVHIAVLVTLLNIPVNISTILLKDGNNDHLVPILLLVSTLGYILISFFANYFYHQNCLNKIDYSNPDPLVKIKPLNNLLAAPLASIIFIVTSALSTALITGFIKLLKLFGIDISY